MKVKHALSMLVATLTVGVIGAAPAFASETSSVGSNWSSTVAHAGETVVATSQTVSKGNDRVSLGKGQELTGLNDVKYPWYAATLNNGTAKVVWGPGLNSANPTQSSTATATDASGSVRPNAASAITCTLLVDNVDLSGRDLVSNTLVTCTGGPSSGITTEAQFRRSSYRGFLGYDGVATSSPTSAQTQDLGWSVPCGAGRGFYDYQLDAQGITGAAGASPHFQSVTANTYDCGGDAP